MIGDSHIGDWGTPFGMWVVGFERWGSEEALRNDGAYELGRLYVRFSEEAENTHELIDEAKAWLKKLEAGDDKARDHRERFGKVSLEHMERVLSRLKKSVDFHRSSSSLVSTSTTTLKSFSLSSAIGR